jgi:hypothetical protein
MKRIYKTVALPFLHVTFTDAVNYARECGNITVIFVCQSQIMDFCMKYYFHHSQAILIVIEGEFRSYLFERESINDESSQELSIIISLAHVILRVRLL